MRGQGCTEERHLFVRASGLQKHADLRLEAHVKHAIGLVKDQIADPTEIQLPSFQEVIHAARCADDAMNTTAELVTLRTLGRTSIAAHRPDVGFAELVGLILDLDRQLAGGREAQQGRGACGSPLLEDPAEGRKEEGNGLATACGGNADHVLALHGQGPTILLDLRRGREACLRKGGLDHGREGRLREFRIARVVRHGAARGVLHLDLIVRNGLSAAMRGGAALRHLLHGRAAYQVSRLVELPVIGLAVRGRASLEWHA
mmetsp:Transcript_56623/g.183438  ORF Transcript_56623/g.183438 Transcript_56623/m.183438 type:complete len:259 (-) Transcript_56623:316-1092(-)